MNTLHNFIFNVYPYICLAVFFMGSLARFDRDPVGLDIAPASFHLFDRQGRTVGASAGRA